MTGIVSKIFSPLKQSLVSKLKTEVLTQQIFTLPAIFLSRWTPDFIIYEDGNSYYTNLVPSSFKPSGPSVYVAKTGSDTTGDGSLANPYASLAKAYAMGASLIYLRAGLYTKTDGFSAGSQQSNRSLGIISYDGPGKAIVARPHTGLSWVQQASPNTSVYAATLTNASTTVTSVVDLNNRRSDEYLKDDVTLLPYDFIKTTSIANCQATPGSYYATTTTLYVRTFDGRSPDSNVLCLSTDSFMWHYSDTNDSKTIYFEGLEIWGTGGVRGQHSVANTAKFVCVDTACRFSGSTLPLFRLQGTAYGYYFNCETTDHKAADGFSYASAASGWPLVRGLEVNCKSRRCGSSGNNMNAFTAHNNSAVIRLNNQGSNTWGPIYADTLGSYSVNLGCYGTTSTSSTADGQKSIFQIGALSDVDGTTTSKMWTKNCTAAGSNNFARAQATGGEFYDLGWFTDLTTGTPKNDYGTINQV